MKKQFSVSGYLLLISATFISACSTDLAVIGDYKETMVVYGLLDQSQQKQYIKINKAFLGEGNAFGYAQVKDSTQYVNSLSVVLKSIKNGVQQGADIPLQPDNTIVKAPGIFYSADQANAIYSFASTGSSTLNSDNEYKLIIKNSETGVVVSSQTTLITDFGNFSSPTLNTQRFNCVIPTNNSYRYQVNWQSGKNAKLYQMIIRLKYTDSTSTGNISDSLDWVFPEQKTQGLAGGEPMKDDFLGQGFLQFIGNQLNDYSGLLGRTPGNVDIIMVAGGDDLNTFIEVNRPSTSIVQEKPEFTNITNGLGVLSSRYKKTYFSKKMADRTRDSLACGQYTRDLKFTNHLGAFCQ